MGAAVDDCVIVVRARTVDLCRLVPYLHHLHNGKQMARAHNYINNIQCHYLTRCVYGLIHPNLANPCDLKRYIY